MINANTITTPPSGPSWGPWKPEQIKKATSKEIAESLKSEKEHFIETMGASFHEVWRKNYAADPKNIDEDGKVKPRIRPTKDKEWIEAHGGIKEVDIYYTPFKDLPLDRKKNNLDAAKVVIDLVYDKVMAGEEITSEMTEEMASVVHDAWMERNSWEKESRPHLFVPYNELPEEEKAKDRDQILQAIKIIKSGR